MGARVLIDPSQHARRHGDVDLFCRAEVALDRHVDHAPHPALVLTTGLVLGHGPERGEVAPVLGQQLAMQFDGLRRVVEGFLDAVAGREAPR